MSDKACKECSKVIRSGKYCLNCLHDRIEERQNKTLLTFGRRNKKERYDYAS